MIFNFEHSHSLNVWRFFYLKIKMKRIIQYILYIYIKKRILFCYHYVFFFFALWQCEDVSMHVLNLFCGLSDAQFGIAQDLSESGSSRALGGGVTQQAQRSLRELGRLRTWLLPRWQLLRQQLSHLPNKTRSLDCRWLTVIATEVLCLESLHLTSRSYFFKLISKTACTAPYWMYVTCWRW